jgi:RHS repeat-associated protein
VTNAAGTTVTQSIYIAVNPAPNPTVNVSSPVIAGGKSSILASVSSQSGGTYAWTISGDGSILGTVGSNVYYLPPSTPGIFTLTCTVTNAAGVSAIGSATVNAIAAPAISYFQASPPVVEVGENETLHFLFSGGQGIVYPGVGPVVSGTDVSVTIPAATTLTLTVTNSLGTSVSSSLNITPVGKSLTIAPSAVQVSGGIQQLFLALDSSGRPITPTWSVNEVGGGTINSGGGYTAPSSPGTYHVKAVRTDAPSVVALAQVTVPVEVGLTPDFEYLQPGGQIAFQGMVSGTMNTALVWSIEEGASGGTITPTGAYTAPQNAGTYHIVATSVAAPAAYAIAAVQVGGGLATVTVSPAQVQIAQGATQTFVASVQNATQTAVNWSCSGGTISGGVFMAPNAPGTYSVTATLVSDTTILGSATVVVSAGTVSATLTYDANGNLISDGTRNFQWDAENRLVSVTITATGHVSQFGYDEFGRRVEIQELDPVSQGSSTLSVASDTDYLWDGTQIVQSMTPSGAVLQQYFEQGFVDSDGTGLYYTRDHLGSIRELTDGQQTVRARYDYDPYGRMTQLQGDRTSPFTYTGHFWHAQSGLDLTLFRAYDSNLGRWISRDPAADSDSDNEYQYVYNTPTIWTDDLGLWGGSPGAGLSGGGGYYWPNPYFLPVGGQISITVDNCGNVWLTFMGGVGTPGPTAGITVGSVNPSPGWGWNGGYTGGGGGFKSRGMPVRGPRVGAGAGVGNGPWGTPGFGIGIPGANVNRTYTYLLHKGHGCDDCPK